MIDIEIKDVDFTFAPQVYIFERDLNGTVTRICKPLAIEWEDYQPGNRLPRATFELQPGWDTVFLTKLVDQLKRYLRVPQLHDESGELKSMKYHLEDMRRLVFSQKGSQVDTNS